MTIQAYIFAHERPNILRECLRTFQRARLPDMRGLIIDDSRTNAVLDVFNESVSERLYYYRKEEPGFSTSARLALHWALEQRPAYVYFIEGDYIFAPDAFARIQDVFEHTTHGRNCFGIVGYDHPNFYRRQYTDGIFPQCMAQQIGFDNVNRAVLHTDFHAEGTRPHVLQRVSNTCWTCYLNWKLILSVSEEFPELVNYLKDAASPRPNPDYPPSGEYARRNVVDDGMLSHGISAVWNAWAIKHGIDRNEYAAWLNIKPSVAQNVNGGGMHTSTPEMTTDNGSPSWQP